MNPRIARNGLSFKGAWQYYMHDPKATTRHRIEWAETYGTVTDDPDLAWKVMAYTAMSQDRLKEASGQKTTGRKDARPVMAYSLAWHPDFEPDRDHMLETAIQSLKVLGLEDHEAFIVAHRDSHPHVHIIANRIHPLTGLVASSSKTKRKLSEFARIYQKEHNMSHYTPKREENYQKRLEGKSTRYGIPAIQEAWNLSDSGRSFALALESQGYLLAQGRKRIVVVDPYGRIHNPVRNLEGVKANEFNERLTDMDPAELRDADRLASIVQAQHEARKRDLADAKREAATEVGPPELTRNFREATVPSAEAIEAQFSTQAKDTSRATRREPNDPPLPDSSIQAINRLQDSHISAQATLANHFHRRISREKAYLGSYYSLREQKEEIRQMEERCKSPSFWRRVTGLARKDRNRLQVLKLNYNSARMRYNERIGEIELQYTDSMLKLKERQGNERARIHGLSIGSHVEVEEKPQREYSSYIERPGPKMERGR